MLLISVVQLQIVYQATWPVFGGKQMKFGRDMVLRPDDLKSWLG